MELTKKLRKVGLTGLAAVVLLSSGGCGYIEKKKEQDVYYKTLTGKNAHVILYSGGKIVGEYDGKITYSSSDSRAFWMEIKDKRGDKREIYWQGDAFIEIEK